jgi:two-component system, OmpR family, sensor kinase
MTSSGTSRSRLRTQVLAGVLAITLLVLAAFDFAAVSAVRQYLVGQTDSSLRKVLSTTQQQLNVLIPAAKSGAPGQALVLGDYYVAFVPSHGAAVTLEAWPGPVPTLRTAGFTAAGKRRAAGKRLTPGKQLTPGEQLILGEQFSKAGSAGSAPRTPAVVIRKGESAVRPAGLVVAAGTFRSWAVTESAPTGSVQYRVAETRADTGTLVASASLADVDATVGRFQAILIAGSAAAGLIIFLGVVLIMRRGMRPIEAMAAQADRINAGDLTGRVSGTDVRSEVGRLGTALNRMLARVESYVSEREESQEHMRCFFADASHELRNPLASLRANAELYQQGALRERWQVAEAMRRIGLEAQRMSRLVDDMLRLARLDQHPGREHAPVDVPAVIEGCVQQARIAYPGRIWRIRADNDVLAAGDEELLRRAVDNLLANVGTHTPDDTIATVTAASRDGRVVLEVSDDGPGVPDDLLPRIFDRFYRAKAPAHRPGSGLGLAIVAEIAAAHEGTAEAVRNEPRGLCVTLTLPAWNHAAHAFLVTSTDAS